MQTFKTTASSPNSTKSISGEVRIRMMDYMVHFKTDVHTLKFECYPIRDWESLTTEEIGFSYIDKENEHNEREVFEYGKCLKKFEGSFCWRGVWEGRLYFTDKEYWGEEIAEMSELYNNYIVIWCKDFINKREHLSRYDD